MEKKEVHKYDDILYLPHPDSASHPRMSLHDRAAQFSPFAALSGYDEAVRETARLTEQERELDEDEKERLNHKLQMLQEYASGESTAREVLATVVYFEPDGRKAGGRYISCTGMVKRIDVNGRKLIMGDRTEIPIERIQEIKGDFDREFSIESF